MQNYFNYEAPPVQNPNLDQISIFLWNNKRLEVLEMRQCHLDDAGSEALADGIARNSTLRHLDISSNKVTGESMKRWEEVLGKSYLRYFDVSHNNLGDEGAVSLVKALLEGGPIRTKADERRDPSKGPAGTRRLPKLRHLLMKNINMGDEAGLVLTQLVS